MLEVIPEHPIDFLLTRSQVYGHVRYCLRASSRNRPLRSIISLNLNMIVRYILVDELLIVKSLNELFDKNIFAIYGIGAHPDYTWCKNVGTAESPQWVNWLNKADMLPAVAPNARILRYGYQSQ
ncbi:hypothetical protein CC78DRAFT_540482 [Lojkania enalia]|uniref:Uncharacterized protein n=1 Tax=Lojkania enalia TaxID=147567 RepID=A0A9P4TNF5_9PLEO|nr:hypothetical protein CC78DRAFT_540482 [Didymosphaeria enalia]